jgi:glycosyltransferase involved in cell wall biosynthesis
LVEEAVVKNANRLDTDYFVVVGIPAFNEEKTIARVVLEAQKNASKVIVCDDGSSDLTGEIAERLGAEVVRHERNLGYGAAVQSLFEEARALNADVLVTLDGDGQHDPSEVACLLKPIVDGSADVVVGSRFLDRHSADLMPWYRRAGVKLITKLANGSSGRSGLLDGQSGFRAYNRKSVEYLSVSEAGMGASVEILISARKQGLRIREVPSSCAYQNGEVKTSSQNPVRHGAGVVASIVKIVIEDQPLRLLGVPGIICIIVGALFGVWMLQLYAIEHRIVTNIALASVAFILIGFFALSTSITLYAIARLSKKMKSGN